MKEKLFTIFSSPVDAETHKTKKSTLKIRLINLLAGRKKKQQNKAKIESDFITLTAFTLMYIGKTWQTELLWFPQDR